MSKKKETNLNVQDSSLFPYGIINLTVRDDAAFVSIVAKNGVIANQCIPARGNVRMNGSENTDCPAVVINCTVDRSVDVGDSFGGDINIANDHSVNIANAILVNIHISHNHAMQRQC
ncbi:hypothetical protein SCACP_30330 [Sporomusa carbonis]